MSVMPIIEHEPCTQVTLLPMPPSQPALLTAEEADQALETVEIVIEQVERLRLVAQATRIRGLTMQAVKELEELRQKAAAIDYPMWQVEQLRDRALTPAREVRTLVRAYSKRIAKQTGR